MHVNLVGAAVWPIIAPAILVRTNELLLFGTDRDRWLFGIDRDRWLTGRPRGDRRRVNVLELGIAVWIMTAVRSFAVHLPSVIQKLRNAARRNPMPHRA